MSTSYDFSENSNFTLSFTIDVDKPEWYSNNEKQSENFLNKDLKEKIPKQKIFRINSLIFNIEKHKKELFSEYDCLYNEQDNSLSILIKKDTNFNKFTKDVMLNIFEFAQNVDIDCIQLLISKKNIQYFEIIKQMLIVGFTEEEKLENVKINDDYFKILKMPMSSLSNEVEDVSFHDYFES